MVDYYKLSADKVLSGLNTSPKGLRSEEAASRLNQYGPNRLKEGKKISPLKIFFSQFNNFLVWILLVAVAISASIGEVVESIVIIIIVLLNAVIGFIQEFRAEKAVEALKKLSGIKADVLRDGVRKQIDAKQLVPGDIIFIETGDKISADCRVIEQSNFETQESSLTGESTPVRKDISALKEAPVAEQINMAFSGTIVTKGRAKAVVVKTGMQTEIGRIAKLIQETKEELTPLQKKLAKFGKQIAVLTLIIAAIVFAATVLRGEDLLEMFKTAVSLAVAAIPEGLPAVVAMSLALGVQRMIKRNALVRKLPSVETLGSTTVIATDKTGTLTMDKMTVKKLYVKGKIVDVAGEGYSTNEKLAAGEDETLLMRIGVLCNDSALSGSGISGDPTEAALLVSAAKAGMIKEELDTRFKRVGEIPFDSGRKRMTTIHEVGNQKIMYTKGAPDVVLKLCDRIYVNGKIKKLTAADKKEIEAVNGKFASDALRVLGFAYKPVKGEKHEEKSLVFVGLQAMIDPPRPEVKKAIEECKEAGIRVIMVTGDHKLTAVAIAKQLGIEGTAITGVELDRIKNIEDKIDEIGVYARVNPEHKIRIIDALKKKKHVAAMTGDGVNDAPALKKADIGIAMGITGTDVAKEASKMVLTDDNFASIVNSVKEGRGIYDNIKKFIYFLLSSNLAEVMVIFAAILIGLKLPLLAIQILWVNLITDGLPAVALGVEPVSKDVMKRRPRKISEGIITKSMIVRLLLMGSVITIGTLSMYLWSLYRSGWTWGQELLSASPDYVYAITMAFTTLVVFEMVNALASKSEEKSFFSGLFDNKWLLLAILSSLLLQAIIIYTPLNAYFHTTALLLTDLAIIFAAATSVIIADSVYKMFRARGSQA
ncbi:calcium-translocating P-type ATPase, SERCA-type [Candidatus Woesearchaeota archaeon]|nr:calcium-translocating P-type ATPase, SERCA-type [Candidatus Woesearchaeota archaeon]